MLLARSRQTEMSEAFEMTGHHLDHAIGVARVFVFRNPLMQFGKILPSPAGQDQLFCVAGIFFGDRAASLCFSRNSRLPSFLMSRARSPGFS